MLFDNIKSLVVCGFELVFPFAEAFNAPSLQKLHQPFLVHRLLLKDYFTVFFSSSGVETSHEMIAFVFGDNRNAIYLQKGFNFILFRYGSVYVFTKQDTTLNGISQKFVYGLFFFVGIPHLTFFPLVCGKWTVTKELRFYLDLGSDGVTMAIGYC